MVRSRNIYSLIQKCMWAIKSMPSKEVSHQFQYLLLFICSLVASEAQIIFEVFTIYLHKGLI